MRKTPVLSTLVAAMALALSGCASTTDAEVRDLVPTASPTPAETRPASVSFTAATADFSIDLLKHVVDGQRNTLISPLSMQLALAMTANGASGQTLSQMEQVLGGGMPIATLNATLPGFAHSLPNTDRAKFHVANSVWYNQANGAKVEQSFLQTVADTYGAGAYAAPFNDQTVNDINAWVNKNTDGMIPTMLSQLDPSDAMVLLNALAFDATWAAPYTKNQVSPGTFTDAAGQKQDATFMASTESSYLDDGQATGFAKSYDNDSYRFVALLPNENVSLTDYVASLTGDTLMTTLAHAQNATVHASLPEFSFSYSMLMNNALTAMGMPDAFTSSADFSRMGTMNGQPLSISQVLHKTFIDVTPLGTRAGAATAVIMGAGAVNGPVPKVVNLDRPFVFAIVDGKTNLPLFLGVVNTIDVTGN